MYRNQKQTKSSLLRHFGVIFNYEKQKTANFIFVYKNSIVLYS